MIRELKSVRPTAPSIWAGTLSGGPVLERELAGLVPVAVRRWQGIDADIDQYALSQHFISVHLGGPKRLVRHGEGHTATRDVASGAYSVVPAAAAFQWQTTGPIDFAHIYFDPKVVDHVVEQAFDRDPRHVQLEEHLGHEDRLTGVLALHLLEELKGGELQQAYIDDLLHLLLCRVLRQHSNARGCSQAAPHVLAPYRLRRALDFIEVHLGEQVGVADIAAASGVSRFHFSRAFHRATGKAPYAYLLDRRIAAAKALLINSDIALAEIGARCGFASASQFSRMFKGDTGVTPSSYRDRQ